MSDKEIMIPLSLFVVRNGKPVKTEKKVFRVSHRTELVRLPGERQWRVWRLGRIDPDDDVEVWVQTEVLSLDEGYEVIKQAKEERAKRPPKRAA